MKGIILCEESQAVTKAFRLLGHEVYSCDIQDCSGGHPEWHIVGDAIEALNSDAWDFVIGHPPCTFMSKAGARWMHPGGIPNVCPDRYAESQKAKEFFLKIWNSGIKKIALENPRPTNVLTEYKPFLPSNTGGAKRGQKYTYVNISQKDSSKTFPGIAKAMAEQWGGLL